MEACSWNTAVFKALIACTNFATGRFDERGTVDIIRGIGKYEGAQGKETVVNNMDKFLSFLAL
jgi:hypothetical protein